MAPDARGDAGTMAAPIMKRLTRPQRQRRFVISAIVSVAGGLVVAAVIAGALVGNRQATQSLKYAAPNVTQGDLTQSFTTLADSAVALLDGKTPEILARAHSDGGERPIDRATRVTVSQMAKVAKAVDAMFEDLARTDVADELQGPEDVAACLRLLSKRRDVLDRHQMLLSQTIVGAIATVKAEIAAWAPETGSGVQEHAAIEWYRGMIDEFFRLEKQRTAKETLVYLTFLDREQVTWVSGEPRFLTQAALVSVRDLMEGIDDLTQVEGRWAKTMQGEYQAGLRAYRAGQIPTPGR